MSTCSVAVGVLSLIAVVHIVVSIVLGALIAVVCYYGRLKHREDRQSAIVEDILAKERSRALLEVESPDKLYLSSPNKTTHTETTTDLSESDTQKKEGLYQSSWADSIVTVETENVKPSVEGVIPRKKSRLSMISIASNISNRFRKSVDLDSQDVLRLVREASSSERESSERDTTDGDDSGLVATLTVGESGIEAPQNSGEVVVLKNDEAEVSDQLRIIDTIDIDVPQDESTC